jgi:GNAT superfamily N-acetyltransferase
MKCTIDKGTIVRDGAFVDVTALNKSGKYLGRAELSLHKTDKKFLWMHLIEVRRECRGKGVGSEMVQQIADYGRKHNAQLVYAYPAALTRESGKQQLKREHFYKQQGFVPCNAPKDAVTITSEGLFKRGVCLFLEKENKKSEAQK